MYGSLLYCMNCLPRPTLWFISRAQKKWSFGGRGAFGRGASCWGSAHQLSADASVCRDRGGRP
eukprot:COSAG02_NODE_4574_length_5204_cov_6.356709_4_plen_63_part_00